MKRALGIAAFAVLFQSSAFADPSSAEMLGMLQKMQKQMNEMQQTIRTQNEKIQRLESRAVEARQVSADMQPAAAPAVPAAASGESIPWMRGLKFGGDFRLRQENFMYHDKNDDAGSTGTAADRERNRYRVRLRFGFEKDYGDDWKLGFRLATGSATDPNSTNQTLGNPGYFTFKAVNVDRAYAIYEPSGLKDDGMLKGVKAGAGKFDNPFLRYSTPIVWDPDVTPEGLFEQAGWRLFSSERNRLSFQATGGQFIVNENAGAETDSNLFGYQGALTLSTDGFGTDRPVDFTAAVSYYDFTNWSQTVLAAGNTAATSFLRTNSIVADDFRVLDIYPEIDFAVHKMPVTLWYDYAVNTANVGTGDAVRSGGNDVHDSDDAWGAGFKLGKVNKKGSWETFYGFYEIGVNAVPAAFSDGDFGGPGTNGFTNRKGHKFGASYMLTDAIAVNWTGYVVKPLHPVAASPDLGLGFATNEEVFRSQLDVVYKF